jgi:Na+/proline symporter
MVSILDILSGAVPLMVDVRQSGGSPVTQTSDLGLVTLYALLATFSMIGALTAVFWLDALTGRTFLLVVVHVAMILPIKFIEHGVVGLGH